MKLPNAKTLIKHYFARKLTTLDARVDVHDTVNIYRTLDKTILEYVNIICDKRYWHVLPGLALLQAVQLCTLYICCGFSEWVGVSWPIKKRLLLFVLPFWYLVDLCKQPFVLPEWHYIIRDSKLRVVGKLSRTDATYSVVLNKERMFSLSVGDVFSSTGEFLPDKFENFALLVANRAAEILKQE